MGDYTHISKMENSMVQQEQILTDLNQVLDRLEAHRTNYQNLIGYYYSEQRSQDLADDSNHLIPDSLCRGVLSEDGIFDLIGDDRDTAIRMLEIAVQMLKA